MCGRFAQFRSLDQYAAGIGWDSSVAESAAPKFKPRYNVPPGSHPWLMHCFEEAPAFAQIHWGYQPSWAAEKGIPMAINARIEKAATGRYFKRLWTSGRAVVPADGWYEWTGEKGHKQPWHIRLVDGGPMYLAAITNARPDRAPKDGDGFVIVTAAADAGMVDVHDRRPVVLSPADALLWMDQTLSPEQAEHIARSMSLPADDFEWYEVSTDVNRVGNDHAHLILPRNC